MAQRRMFSPAIVNSDAFLEMPPSTQALYFQLGMKADDDGFVNPKMVMRMMGSSDDELKVLLAKRFLISFDNGVVVVKHWKVNNLVRKDWYRPTIYLEQKNLLFTKENGAYTLDNTQGTPLVNEPLTQVRLGKDRLLIDSKESKGKKKPLKVNKTSMSWKKPYNENSHNDNEEELQIDPDFVPKGKEEKKSVRAEVQAVFDLFDNPAKNVWAMRPLERAAASTLLEAFGIEVLERRMKRIKKEQEKDDPYFPNVYSPSQLLENMPKIERYLKV